MNDKSSLAIASHKLQNEFIKTLTNGSINDVKIFFGTHGQIELPEGRSPLHHATKNKNSAVIRYLLEEKRLNPNTEDFAGTTPLHWASGEESGIEIILLLIGYGASTIKN